MIENSQQQYCTVCGAVHSEAELKDAMHGKVCAMCAKSRRLSRIILFAPVLLFFTALSLIVILTGESKWNIALLALISVLLFLVSNCLEKYVTRALTLNAERKQGIKHERVPARRFWRSVRATYMYGLRSLFLWRLCLWRSE